MDPAAFLRQLQPAQADVSLRARRAVVAADPDLEERIYRGWRAVGYRHPEAGYVCGIFPRDDAVQLLFEHGASLPDPEGVLEGAGSQTRLIRLATVDAVRPDTIARYVQQAIAQRLLR